jgi:hypothetical protein
MDKLEACGVAEGELCAAMVISVQGGKVRGSRWTLVGDLGLVEVSTHRLDGARRVIVTVDLTDMSKFVFPAATDPRTGANRGEWVEGCTLAVKMVTGERRHHRQEHLDKHRLIHRWGFQPPRSDCTYRYGPSYGLGGSRTPEWMIKGEAENRGLTGYEANIPTFGVKLLKKSKKRSPWRGTSYPSPGACTPCCRYHPLGG